MPMLALDLPFEGIVAAYLGRIAVIDLALIAPFRLSLPLAACVIVRRS
jgi:hypothetical protein